MLLRTTPQRAQNWEGSAVLGYLTPNVVRMAEQHFDHGAQQVPRIKISIAFSLFLKSGSMWVSAAKVSGSMWGFSSLGPLLVVQGQGRVGARLPPLLEELPHSRVPQEPFRVVDTLHGQRLWRASAILR